MNSRIIKVAFSTFVGIYLTLIVFNNITDYGSNFQFVIQVTSMEDTFAFQANQWRSINNPILHHIFYISIIALELTVCSLCLFGAYKMATHLKADQEQFKRAKMASTLGYALGIGLWFFVFAAIAGEWFLMWQSEEWNAQDTAFSLTCIFLLFLIFHTQENE